MLDAYQGVAAESVMQQALLLLARIRRLFQPSRLPVILASDVTS